MVVLDLGLLGLVVLDDVEKRLIRSHTVVDVLALGADSLVAALDLGPQAGSEALLLGDLDAELVHERARQVGAGDKAAVDEDLAEPLAGRRLLGERGLELAFADQPTADEQLAQGAPRDVCSFHGCLYRHDRSRT